MDISSTERPVAASARMMAPAALAHEPPFHIGDILIQPALRRATRPDGATTTLEPLMMQVLVMLAYADGAVVSRDDLIESCWGGRAVGDDSIARVIFHLRKLAAGFAGGAFAIETMAKVGFRLVGDVAGSPSSERSKSPPRWAMPRGRTIAVAALLIFAVIGLGAYNAKSPDPVSIAVLPFEARGTTNDDITAGLTEEILGQLAREPGFKLVGQHSARYFAGPAMNVREAGRSLDVEYVLAGTVERHGSRLRAVVTLSDARSSRRVWSRVFVENPDDALRIQDRIVLGVLASLQDRVGESSKSRRAMTTHAAVSELRLTALGLMRERDPGSLATAVRLLRRAVQIDPGYAPAWASLGAAIKMEWFYRGDRSGRAAAIREATQMEQRALALAPDLAEAHATLGMIWDFERRGLAHLERAVVLAPGDAQAWYWLYLTRDQAFDFSGALAAAREMARLDPFWIHSRHYPIYAWSMGRRDEAVRFSELLSQKQPDLYLRKSAAANLAFMRGDLSEAYVLSTQAARLASPGLNEAANRVPASILARLGYINEAARRSVIPDHVFKLITGRAPSLAHLMKVFPDLREFWEAEETRVLTLRLLLRDNRADEIVMLYDAAFASPTAMFQHYPAGIAARVDDASYVAIALRAVGREADARELLEVAAVRIAPVARRSDVPAPMLAAFARNAAARGDHDVAIAVLERAIDNGWAYGDHSIVPRLGDDPAFAALASNRRLAALDSRVQSSLARERRETLAVLGHAGTI